MNSEVLSEVDEWHSTMGEVVLTEDQRKRKRKGLPIFRRDEVIEPYDYSKGEFV